MEYSIIGQKPKRNYAGIGGNNMDKFIHHQILANTLILKLKWNENVSVIFPIDILFTIMKSVFLSGSLVRIPA